MPHLQHVTRHSRINLSYLLRSALRHLCRRLRSRPFLTQATQAPVSSLSAAIAGLPELPLSPRASTVGSYLTYQLRRVAASYTYNMLGSAGAKVLLLLSAQLSIASAARGSQAVLQPSHEQPFTQKQHKVSASIVEALETHQNPVDALLSLHPELAGQLAEPRLLHVAGEKEPQWMTEGDKMRLRRQNKKFMDITDHHEFYAQQVESSTSGKPRS